ncbi:MAG: SufE family protein [Bacteroidales bacterium]
MIKTVAEVEKEIVEEFSLFDEWLEKYEYLIELGGSLNLIPDSGKRDENLIKGCQSRVWLDATYNNGTLEFRADSDAIITKGIISLLLRLFSGRTPQEILSSKLTFLQEIGLQENLSPTRANGLLSMIKKIQAYALAYSTLEQQK